MRSRGCLCVAVRGQAQRALRLLSCCACQHWIGGRTDRWGRSLPLLELTLVDGRSSQPALDITLL